MKFVLINNSSVETTKEAKGVCPNCGIELIAKCGEREFASVIKA